MQETPLDSEDDEKCLDEAEKNGNILDVTNEISVKQACDLLVEGVFDREEFNGCGHFTQKIIPDMAKLKLDTSIQTTVNHDVEPKEREFQDQTYE
uniref:Uncharacterized protein n=1 Tax=Romanomermis culicivorax TaxID=13658 RepID=A0A915IEB5_ROMCU